MSEGTETRQGVRHLPPGEGKAVWVVGDTYTFKAIGEETDGSFMLFEASIPPGSGPPPHLHLREHEAYYVLEGEIEVLDGDRSFVAGAGSFVHVPKGAVHRFENVGQTDARMLVLAAPAGLEGFLLEVGQPAVEGGTAPPLGEEEMERTVRAAPKYGLELLLPPEQ